MLIKACPVVIKLQISCWRQYDFPKTQHQASRCGRTFMHSNARYLVHVKVGCVFFFGAPSCPLYPR